MSIRRCSICKSETRAAKISLVTGEEAPLAVTVHDLPVLQCPQGHRLFAHEDFPLLLLDHLLEQDEPQLPVSEAKGLLFKHYHCAECGSELGAGTEQSHTFRIDVELPDLAPFEVDVTLPVHRCARCGHEQLHSLKEVRRRTPAALAHAFKAAQIVPA